MVDFKERNSIEPNFVEEIGHFTTKNPNDPRTDPNLVGYDLSILVIEEHEHHGLARLMIAAFIYEVIQTDKLKIDKLLCIDTDASGGFWEKIGLLENPAFINKNKEDMNYIYEMCAPISAISCWAFGYVYEKI